MNSFVRFTIVLSMLTVLLTGCGSDDNGGSVTNNFSWIAVPEGHFLMGTFEDPNYPDEAPIHTVYFESFSITKSEVTNAQYVDYLNDAQERGYIFTTANKIYGAYGDYLGYLYMDLDVAPVDAIPANQSHIYFEDGLYYVDIGYENWPVTYISWYGAYAFTQFYNEVYGVSMGLPTEAEWEYVANSGAEYEHAYPTSDGTLSCDLASFRCGAAYGNLTTAGTYPSTPWGVVDLAGNVREWCWDWYDADFYSNSTSSNPLNYSGSEPPQDGSAVGGDGVAYNYDTRVVRGGSYRDFEDMLRSASRDQDYSFNLNSYTGFRVVLR